MKEVRNLFIPIIRMSLIILLLCGLLYPLVSTGIANVLMPEKAEGSLINNKKGEIIGSKLIGQNFTSPIFFHGRISSIGDNAASSGSTNYAPSNPNMIKRVKQSILDLKKQNPSIQVNKIPIDLITNSGSGLDPDISLQAALIQVNRISNETGIDKIVLEKLVKKHIEGRQLGIFGEEHVNVLKINLDLFKLMNK
ncbi:MAG: potassium-transporting ATPase subunit KdpC [Bacillota bacterium]|nr:potassium-transporting ATPase subunit KdpC [Bacillota bacterium]